MADKSTSTLVNDSSPPLDARLSTSAGTVPSATPVDVVPHHYYLSFVLQDWTVPMTFQMGHSLVLRCQGASAFSGNVVGIGEAGPGCVTLQLRGRRLDLLPTNEVTAYLIIPYTGLARWLRMRHAIRNIIWALARCVLPHPAEWLAISPHASPSGATAYMQQYPVFAQLTYYPKVGAASQPLTTKQDSGASTSGTNTAFTPPLYGLQIFCKSQKNPIVRVTPVLKKEADSDATPSTIPRPNTPIPSSVTQTEMKSS